MGKKAYEDDKKTFAEQKRILEEHTQEWKNKAEFEESQKLEQIISNKLTQKKIDATEERATELLVEFNKLKIQQEAELYSMIKKHRDAITEETKMKELLERNHC